MEDSFVHLRFHHKGKFQNDRYVGGQEHVVVSVELDRFSYTVLMEYVKDELDYTEIGGIYTRIGKTGGWKLCANDADLSELVRVVNHGDHMDFYIDNMVDTTIEPLKQMQPHVVMRPRKNVFAAKNNVKRTFVTTHQLQQQKNKKEILNSPRKSARLNIPGGFSGLQNNQEQLQQQKSKKPVLDSPRKSARLNSPSGFSGLQNHQEKLQQQKSKKEVLNSPRKSARLNSLGGFSGLQNNQEQQKNKKEVLISPRKSARLNNPGGFSGLKNNQEVNSRRKSAQEVHDAPLNLNPASVKRKLDLCNRGNENVGENEDLGEDENMGENEIEELPPPAPICEYEKNRFNNVTLNDQVYKMLGLPTLAVSLRSEMKKSQGKEKVQDEGSEYAPEEEVDIVVDSREKKRKMPKKALKTKLPNGPTTRSRCNILTAPEKDATEKEVINSILVEAPAPVKLPSIAGVGSMASYLAMRERQKNEYAQKKIAIVGPSQTTNEPVNGTDGENDMRDVGEAGGEGEVPKRTRGKTLMNTVHTRPFEKRVPLNMNKKFQPVSDDDKVMSELGYFLGTLKKCVPLTYRSWRDVPENLKTTLLNYVKQRYILPEECEDWVMKSINSDWRGYKSRIKTAHYTAYPTDEERLEKRPENIPLEDFKLLLKYWGDEEIQRKAKKNSETRLNYVDTHTAGPKLFSQIRHKMANESDGALFVKTRKRKPNRMYKTDGKVNKFIIDKIEKAMGPDLSGPTDGVDDLLFNGKKHGPSWLIGRCGKSNKSSSSGPTNEQISDLTKKIRQDIIDEMQDNLKKVQEEVDAKVNKVNQNLTWVFKKLAEANPGIKIDVAQLCATISSDNDDGTPFTGGATS